MSYELSLRNTHRVSKSLLFLDLTDTGCQLQVQAAFIEGNEPRCRLIGGWEDPAEGEGPGHYRQKYVLLLPVNEPLTT
jgi:hypothetical protein